MEQSAVLTSYVGLFLEAALTKSPVVEPPMMMASPFGSVSTVGYHLASLRPFSMSSHCPPGVRKRVPLRPLVEPWPWPALPPVLNHRPSPRPDPPEQNVLLLSTMAVALRDSRSNSDAHTDGAPVTLLTTLSGLASVRSTMYSFEFWPRNMACAFTPVSPTISKVPGDPANTGSAATRVSSSRSERAMLFCCRQ